MKALPNKAKAYIACTAIAGFALLALGLYQGAFPSPKRFLIYLLLALLASTLKMRLPGITGTMSVNFLFILMGIADYTFSQTVAAACAAALVQSLWRAKQRTQFVQVLFNVATLAISTSAAYLGTHSIAAAAGTDSLAVMLALATCLFVITNTGLVALVLSLTEEKPLQKVWKRCYTLSFPYYLVGAAIAAVVCVSGRAVGWKIALLILPVMVLTYLYYRLYLERIEQEQIALSPAGRQDAAAVSSARVVERVNGGEREDLSPGGSRNP